MNQAARWIPPAAAVLAAALVFAAGAADAAKKKHSKKSPEPTAVPRPPDPYRVTVLTADGVPLAATYRPVPGRPDAPGIALVHDFSRDRRSWDPFVPDLLARGFATLAIDLRAHGESTRGPKGALHLSPRLMQDPLAFPRDVEAACRWLRGRTRSVGVIGLSLGGNLAVLATANAWADAGVSLSANTERLAPLAGRLATKAHALLVIAAEKDAGRAASARAIEAAATPPKKLLLVPGAAHNLALFTERPETKSAALDWLAHLLLPPPTPTPTPYVVREESPAFVGTPAPEPILSREAPTPEPEPFGPTPTPEER